MRWGLAGLFGQGILPIFSNMRIGWLVLVGVFEFYLPFIIFLLFVIPYVVLGTLLVTILYSLGMRVMSVNPSSLFPFPIFSSSTKKSPFPIRLKPRSRKA